MTRLPGLAARLLVGVVGAGVVAACDRPDQTPAIVYPLPWLGDALAKAARQYVADWDPPRPEIVSQRPSAFGGQTGYAGDVEWAQTTVALPNIAIAIGPQSSRSTLLVARIYADRRIPLISATATSQLIRDVSPWIFQLAPSNYEEGQFIARFIHERLAAQRVTIFYLNSDEYGTGLRAGVVAGLKEHHVVVADEVGVMRQSDFPRRVARSWRRAPADAVVLATRGPEAVAIVNALRPLAPRIPILLGDGAPLSEEFVKAAGPNSENVLGASWWDAGLPDAASRAFVQRYRIAGGVPSAAAAMYFDALMLAARAVHDVGGNGPALRKYLNELGRSRPAYRGITGPIQFTADRPANLVMIRHEHGATTVVP